MASPETKSAFLFLFFLAFFLINILSKQQKADFKVYFLDLSPSKLEVTKALFNMNLISTA